MAVIIDCKDSVCLIKKIKESINDGDIDTWSIDEDGDITHVPEQWNCKAWMHLTKDNDLAKSDKGKLVFGIIGNKRIKMSKLIYAVYHGRFAEMLLFHFDDYISNIIITSNKTEYDFFH